MKTKTSNPLLEVGEDGHLVGRDPMTLTPEELEGLERSRTKAIRARCLDCCGGAYSEVRKCVSTTCPLWPFRLGTSPFSTRTTTPEVQAKRVEALKKARKARVKKVNG